MSRLPGTREGRHRKVSFFPALLVICSVVEPTLMSRDLPLSSDAKSNDFAEVDMRIPPISIGLTCPTDTAGRGKFFSTMIGKEVGCRFNIEVVKRFWEI